MKTLLLGLYVLGDVTTLAYLLFMDGTRYNWWNWLVIVPMDFILAAMWPIYWTVLRPLLG